MATVGGQMPVEEVFSVAWLPGDVELGDEGWTAGWEHGGVDMRRTPRVRYRADRAEPIPPFAIRDGMAMALEGRVKGRVARVAGMAVAPVGVILPDLDPVVRQRTSIEDTLPFRFQMAPLARPA